jgi:hypothetical protein
VQNIKKCLPLTLETVLGSGLPSIFKQLTSLSGWQRQSRLDVTDDVIDRVIGSEGIVTREAVGAVPDAIGADDDGSQRHPFQRWEIKTFSLMRQEYRDAGLLDTGQKIRARKLFNQDVDVAAVPSESIRHLRGKLRFF